MSQYKKIARDGANITSKSHTVGNSSSQQEYHKTPDKATVSEREQFIFHRRYFEAMLELEYEDAIETLYALCMYAFYGEESELSGYAKALFCLMKHTIDAERDKGGALCQN